MQAEATIHEGMVEIPPSIREALHLRNGDTLVFDADESGVRLRVQHCVFSTAPYVPHLMTLSAFFGNASEGKSIEQIVAEEREERGLRML